MNIDVLMSILDNTNHIAFAQVYPDQEGGEARRGDGDPPAPGRGVLGAHRRPAARRKQAGKAEILLYTCVG